MLFLRGFARCRCATMREASECVRGRLRIDRDRSLIKSLIASAIQKRYVILCGLISLDLLGRLSEISLTQNLPFISQQSRLCNFKSNRGKWSVLSKAPFAQDFSRCRENDWTHAHEVHWFSHYMRLLVSRQKSIEKTGVTIVLFFDHLPHAA
jgi:hypothetical protein